MNAGSLDPRLLAKYGKATPEALAESALWEASLFEEHGFSDIKISVKHHDPVIMVNAYRILAAKCDYPLHLGVTEAGPLFQGTIKSATAFGILLAEGIGDTIRVSLSAPPVEEVKVGISILESLNLRQRKLEIVSCVQYVINVLVELLSVITCQKTSYEFGEGLFFILFEMKYDDSPKRACDPGLAVRNLSRSAGS